MGDTELQPSKKRAAGNQHSRDNPDLDDEDTTEQETGTFKKASDEVMAGRRIVKVCRDNPERPSPNPFAGIRRAPPESKTIHSVASTEAECGKTIPKEDEEKSVAKKETSDHAQQSEGDVSDAKHELVAENEKPYSNLENNKSVDKKSAEGNSKSDEEDKKVAANYDEGKDGEEARKHVEVENEEVQANKDADVVKTDTEEKKEGGENVEGSSGTSSFSSFQRLSSNQNAFTGLAGTGFSSSTFSLGSIGKDGSSSLSGMKSNQPSSGFGLSSNGSSSIFGSSASIVNKSEGTGFSPMHKVPTETGEENENSVFTADSILFEFLDGAWRERGKGELKVNVSTTETGKARLIMRSKGNLRLILNANLYPEMKLANMEKRGISFACINSAACEGKGDLSTYAFKFKDSSIVEEFRAAVTELKGKSSVSLMAPENSPKASED